jgi:PST family polysaccharide transporter
MGARGFFWTGGAQILDQTLHIGIRVVLARLLLPADFGLLAMATVFVAITTVVTDLGLGNALVQRSEVGERHRSTLFWFTFAVSLALMLLLLAGAPLVGRFFHEPRVVPVLRVLAASLVLAAPEGTYASLLLREMDFKSLGLRQVVGTAVAGVVGLAAAMAGLGVWALVLYALAQAAARSALLLWRSSWRPRLVWSSSALRDLWSFGRWVAGSRLVNYANRNADNVLVGRFLGARELGFYSFSYQAVLLPLLYVARPITSVSFPSFAQLQNDRERCARAYLRTLEVTVLVAFPLAALGAVAAPAAIPLVFGAEWGPAAPVFVLLCGVAALHSFMNLASALFDGLGLPRIGFRWMLYVVLPLNLVAFAVGLRWAAAGVAAGLLVAAAVQVPIQMELLARLASIPRSGLGGLLLRGLLLWGAMAGGWTLASLAVDPGSGYLALGGAVACALAVTGAFSFVVFRDAWGSVLEGARSLRS